MRSPQSRCFPSPTSRATRLRGRRADAVWRAAVSGFGLLLILPAAVRLARAQSQTTPSTPAPTLVAVPAAGPSTNPTDSAGASYRTTHASQEEGSTNHLVEPDAPPLWANRGRWTFGFQLGYGLENAIPRNISHVSLLIAQPQLGLIVWDSPQSRLPARRFEILSEGILGNAIHPGGRVTGHTLLFRFDGKARSRLVPFFDMGAGVLNTTLDTRIPEISGHVQFTPQGGFGVQYFFNPQRAMVFEYRYMHMSNASLMPPNHGFNSSMVTVGFRWLRRPARPAALRSSSRSRPFPNLVHALFGSD
jgi:hypothetical protein